MAQDLASHNDHNSTSHEKVGRQTSISQNEREAQCNTEEADDDLSFVHSFKQESEELMKLALPIIATSCLSFMTQVVDLAMVGECNS